jgi:hypothetical protein
MAAYVCAWQRAICRDTGTPKWMHMWLKWMAPQTSKQGHFSRRQEGYQAQANVCTWQRAIYRIEGNSSKPIKYRYMWVLHHCLWSFFLGGILLTETWPVGTKLMFVTGNILYSLYQGMGTIDFLLDFVGENRRWSIFVQRVQTRHIIRIHFAGCTPQ